MATAITSTWSIQTSVTSFPVILLSLLKLTSSESKTSVWLIQTSIKFHSAQTRTVLHVWSQLWSLLGLEHWAGWLSERGSGEREKLIVEEEKAKILRLLLWGQGCLCRRGMHIHWSATFNQMSTHLLRLLSVGLWIHISNGFLFTLAGAGGWVWDGLGPWAVDKHLDTAGEPEMREMRERREGCK